MSTDRRIFYSTLEQIVLSEDMFTYLVHQSLHFFHERKRGLGKPRIRRIRAAVAQPIVLGAERRAALKGQRTSKANLKERMHHLVHVHRTHERQNVLILSAAIVIEMNRAQTISHRQNIIKLVSLNICMTGVPTCTKSRMINKVHKLLHVRTREKIEPRGHICLGGVLAQNVDTASLHTRIVKDPLPIKTITYRELRELSYMGASVLHEDAIFPVRYAGIPINIRNTNIPEAPGTMIVSATSEYDSERIITGIAGKKGFSVITIEKDMMNSEIGFGRKILDVLEDNDIPFEHLPSGVDTMSVIVSTSYLKSRRERILTSMNKRVHPDSIVIEDDLALLAIVGRSMVKSKGTAARVFKAISAADINIRMIDQGSSELNIIIGVEEHDLDKALNAIYQEFVKA